MKTIHTILLYLVLSASCFAGEALGIAYDGVYLVRLKHPEASRKKAVIFDATGKASQMVIGAYKINTASHKNIDALFNPKSNFDHGLADSRLQLYSLVFYRGGKAVLTITPNLTGGDLYASDKKGYDPRSFSKKQRAQFLNIVHRYLGGLRASVALPKKES